ncbi:hypothetical protein BGZ65_001643 [Modicella reniformis]|uniref:Uncharacterized protein n=1 Tax=Modicella reniformis TaxID=1440133 RepID=A0A9P6M9V4_9FUNG|nr:hypothetical protein BGZ65_001643 [Modicella reniformis]
MIFTALGAVISHNPGIQELEWGTYSHINIRDFVELVLKRTNRHLKKLSISGDFNGQEWQVIEYLINANGKRLQQPPEHEQQKQERRLGQPAMTQGLQEDGSIIGAESTSRKIFGTTALDNNNGGDGGCELEELNLSSKSYNMTTLLLDMRALCDLPGLLPIRSLTLLEFRTMPSNGSLLEILRKCPNLEKLCVSFDMSSTLLDDTSRDVFSEYNLGFSFFLGLPIYEQHDFVKVIRLPHLEEFRARSVPLAAAHLIMEGGWICKGLEVLEIFVLVPKLAQILWIQNDWWSRTRLEIDAVVKDLNKNEDNNNNAIYVKGTTKKRKRNPPEEDDDDDDEPRHPHQAQKLNPKQFTKQIQIRVCEMIGCLTRLRELRIEGKGSVWVDSSQWDCLELTLETGLDRLAPLQQNLEKLVVSALDERLCGRREVE